MRLTFAAVGLSRFTEPCIFAGLFGPIAAAIYYTVGARGAEHLEHAPGWFITPLDSVTPFLPSAVWIYLSWYPAIVLLALADRTTVRRAYIGFVIALLSCSVGHFMWPVTLARPLVDTSLGLSARTLAWFYSVDPPRNLFPSFHAAGAVLVVALRPKSRGIGTLWAIAVCASCVLIKQHYALDIMAGIVVGVSAAALTSRVLASLSAIGRGGLGSLWPCPRKVSDREEAPGRPLPAGNVLRRP